MINVIRTMSPIDGLDILILAWVIYKGIKIVSETRAGQLVKGIAFLGILFLASSLLGLKSMNFLLTNVFQIGVIALFVVFQPELRRALERIGRTQVTSLPVFGSSQDESTQIERINTLIDATVEAAVALSEDKTGAIIVFERKTRLGEIISTGTVVDSAPTAALIGNIFFKNSPLHDGAMIVRDGRIYAAGCFLPLSENDTISRQLGTRHRAALGMSENSDALIVVVSEETGLITLAFNGKLTRDVDAVTLRRRLEEMLLPERYVDGGDKEKKDKKELLRREFHRKGRGK